MGLGWYRSGARKRTVSGGKRIKEEEYVEPGIKLCAKVCASFVCVGGPPRDSSHAAGHIFVNVHFDLDADAIYGDAFSGGL